MSVRHRYVVLNGARAGTPIHVRDVARVTLGSAPQVGAIPKNGDPTEFTSGVVLQRKGESTRAVMTRVQEQLAGIRRSLSQLADITEVEGTAEISRENQQRSLTVSCNVRGRDIGGFVSEAKSKIGAGVRLPPGYFVSWGGQVENQERATKRLAVVVPLVIVLIFFLLYAAFQSGRSASLILLNIPFALIGGIVALWLAGLHLEVAAFIGFIALFGVSVQNGLIMVTQFNALREQGLSLRDAVKQGAEDRFRPVLMTALVASLGFVPMALATGVGAEIPKPLATVVIGGLLSSTSLTLFLLPVLYAWMESRRAPAPQSTVEAT